MDPKTELLCSLWVVQMAEVRLRAGVGPTLVPTLGRQEGCSLPQPLASSSQVSFSLWEDQKRTLAFWEATNTAITLSGRQPVASTLVGW